MPTWNLIDCPDDLKVIVNCDFPVNFCLFCLRYGHVICDMVMLFVCPLVGGL
ncbi:hypothetical protein SLEP1_g31628 [Rubroshorea leprosula]|uniref:Uncharacterized protein n=1 Tax=Rubroshorea leprosula TaxID=152421 RepID=A0AAV5KAZ1_9ROSI|nr:hypothetical protein SLEP1_g31628 [Rubroshorea leprosula]